MDLKDIQTLIQFLKQNEITEFELDHDGTKLKLARGAQMIMAAPVQQTISPAIQSAVISTPVAPAAVANSDAKGGAAPANPNLKKVESPIVGTFYGRPSPEAPVFAKAGDKVKKGQKLCIIEAMKLMNDMPAEVSGKVVKLLVDNGTTVEYGQPLFLVDPKG